MFPDGQLPSKENIKKWLSIVDNFFSDIHSASTTMLDGGSRDAEENLKVAQVRRNSAPDGSGKNEIRRIGVHCVAGLGRAPFLVAIALVNNGCSPANAIELIRKNRPGAFNIN